MAWTIDPTEEIFRMRKKLVRSGVQKSYLNDFLERHNKNSDEDTVEMSTSQRDRQASSTLDTLMQSSGDLIGDDRNDVRSVVYLIFNLKFISSN